LVLILDDGMLKYESADVSVVAATDQFAAIINPPQSGILAVGAAAEKVIVEQGQMTIANIMSVTLSADYRAVDGALAAELLKSFRHRI
jgi:pyruvate dehydrogenase E2 component (dihydrolipoamide acetyltransferase)